MMNVMSTLLATRAFSSVINGMDQKHFSLAPLASSKLPAFCINNAINLKFITLTIYHTFRGGTSFYPQLRHFILCSIA